ncbi:MAG: hypothetical protein SFZ23_06075 [Planctomycetota bacterium]|nr:hypothetical protein [Planctomycetota bacterium]
MPKGPPPGRDEDPSDDDVARFSTATIPCTKCGAAVYDEASWCHKCGAVMGEKQDVATRWPTVVVGIIIAAFLFFSLRGLM